MYEYFQTFAFKAKMPQRVEGKIKKKKFFENVIESQEVIFYNVINHNILSKAQRISSPRFSTDVYFCFKSSSHF